MEGLFRQDSLGGQGRLGTCMRSKGQTQVIWDTQRGALQEACAKACGQTAGCIVETASGSPRPDQRWGGREWPEMAQKVGVRTSTSRGWLHSELFSRLQMSPEG